jgi:aryl-alcohol dehydrogenase-like predicted oxidoreductase
LNRVFESGSAEICVREDGAISLLQWLWDRKILDRRKHPNARINLFQFARYNSAQCAEGQSYIRKLRVKNGLTLTELSLAFIEQQSFVTSTIELQQWNN